MRNVLIWGFLAFPISGALASTPAQKYWIVRATLTCVACEQDGKIFIVGNKPATYITGKPQCETKRKEFVDAVKKVVKDKKLKIKSMCEATANPAAVEAEE